MYSQVDIIASALITVHTGIYLELVHPSRPLQYADHNLEKKE
jgi:hypothetical protein